MVQVPAVLHGETMLDPGQHHSLYDLAACELRHCIDLFNYQADDQRRDTLELPGEDSHTSLSSTSKPYDPTRPFSLHYDTYYGGSFFVCRADKKPLLPTHVYATIRYFQAQLEDYRVSMKHQGLNCDLDGMHVGYPKQYEDGPWLTMLSRGGFEKWYTEHQYMTYLTTLVRTGLEMEQLGTIADRLD
jgi:hypothetical protein